MLTLTIAMLTSCVEYSTIFKEIQKIVVVLLYILQFLYFKNTSSLVLCSIRAQAIFLVYPRVRAYIYDLQRWLRRVSREVFIGRDTTFWFSKRIFLVFARVVAVQHTTVPPCTLKTQNVDISNNRSLLLCVQFR